jgi:TPP-dependent indolepyruvate ferredoxin oxidoreductase alpha subunit
MVHLLGDCYYFHSEVTQLITAICYIYPYILIVFLFNVLVSLSFDYE